MLFEISNRPTRALGIANHDADVVPAPLDSLGFLAVEGLSDLSTEVRQRKAQHFGRRLDVELDLLLPFPERVGNLVNAGIFLQSGLELIGSGAKLVDVRASKLDVDILPCREQGRVELELHDVGDGRGSLAPAIHGFGTGKGSFLSRGQLDEDLAQVGRATPDCLRSCLEVLVGLSIVRLWIAETV